MKTWSLCLASLAAFALSGCLVQPAAEGPYCEGPGCPGGGHGDDDDDDDLPPPQPGYSEERIIAEVSQLFQEKCLTCHGNGRSFGGLSDIYDVAELKRRNLIAERAELSPLFRIIESEHMAGALDPATGRPVELPTDQQVDFVRLWINLGAPELRHRREPISLDTYLRRLRDNAAKFPREERPDLVAVDFHAAYNNRRFADVELNALANATLKLLNQLDAFSTTSNRSGLRIAFDDRDVPIGIIFNPRRFNLDKQADVNDLIVRLANRQDRNDPFACDVPSIPVLDFLHIGSSDDVFNAIDETFESGYSNVTLQKLLAANGLLAPDQKVFEAIDQATFVANGFANVAQGVDLYAALQAIDSTNFNRDELRVLYTDAPDRERLVRGCLLNSSVSSAARCVDRLAQSSPAGGATYLAWNTHAAGGFDNFLNAGFVGPGNPPADPLGPPQDGFTPFTVDGGEAKFQQSNAMLGFVSFNGNFQLVSNTPTYAVPGPPDGDRVPMTSSAACNSCHAGAVVPFQDALRPALPVNGPDGVNGAAFAFKVSQSQEAWDAQLTLDAQYYTETLRNVYVARAESGALDDGIWAFGSQYLRDLSLQDVAAELGIESEDELREGLGQINWAADFAEPPLAEGGISRANFTRNYQFLVSELAGSNEDFLRGCLAREASDLGTGDDLDDDPEFDL